MSHTPAEKLSQAKDVEGSFAPASVLPKHSTPAFGVAAQPGGAATAVARTSAVGPASELPGPNPAGPFGHVTEPPHTVEIHAEPASAGARLCAALFDGLFLGALFVGFLFVAQAIAGPGPAGPRSGLLDRALAARGALLPGLALLAALAFVYTSLFHMLGGRTLGKRLLGLTVLDRNGKPPRLAISAARSALALISGVPLLGFLWVFVTRSRQALHDKLTRTYVVRLLAGPPQDRQGGQ